MAYHEDQTDTRVAIVTTKPSGVPPEEGVVVVYYNATYSYYTPYRATATVWVPLTQGTAQLHQGPPSTVPDFVGQVAIDQLAPEPFIAIGTNSSADWKTMLQTTGGGS